APNWATCYPSRQLAQLHPSTRWATHSIQPQHFQYMPSTIRPAADQSLGQEPLTASVLDLEPPQEQKQMLGDRWLTDDPHENESKCSKFVDDFVVRG
ncbi:hypothetical protein P4O66_003968, partial [Electrophorus voltai]